MNRTLDRYILHEFIPPFFGGLSIFSFILIMDKVLKLTDIIFMKGLGIRHLAKLFFYLLPPLLSFTIPVSILFAALLCFGRLASDNEIMAFWGCGLHPVRIILPVLFFGVISFFICLWLETLVIPSANESFKAFIISSQLRKEFIEIREEEFQELGNDLTIYVKKKVYSNEGEASGYKGIIIANQQLRGQSHLIIAQEGKITTQRAEGTLLITLIDGSIHSLDQMEKQIYHTLNFKIYKVTVPLPDWSNISSRQRSYKELSQKALFNSIKSRKTLGFEEKTKMSLEFHRRFAFPFACLIFVFIGSFVGMLSKWSGKASGFAVSLLIIIVYYFITIIGFRLSMLGYILPWFAVWLPNICFSLLALCFIRENI